MHIVLTFDYELFFGSKTGSVQKCMLEPTERLLQLSQKYKVPMTFFVDVGLLLKMEEFPELKSDLDLVKQQIQRIQQLGSSIQLHIHPHWEKAKFEKGEWRINTKGCYKLSDFTPDESNAIILKYKAYLDDLIGATTSVFRAGGWCVQPFSQFKEAFKSSGIKIDSSVFPGGAFESSDYNFDFRTAPKKDKYRFEDDVCREDKNGYFIEYPISSYRYSPLFYWKLYIWGRLFPKKHKMVGDGSFLAQPGRKKTVLTSFTWNHVSTDGYYASMMEKSLKYQLRLGNQIMISIGHPKGNTLFSEEKLEKFIQKNHTKHKFVTFTELS